MDAEGDIDIKEEPLSYDDPNEDESGEEAAQERIYVRTGLSDNTSNDPDYEISEFDGSKKRAGSSRGGKKAAASALKKKTPATYNLIWIFENIKTELDAALFFQKFEVIPSSKRCEKEHPMTMTMQCKDEKVVWECSEKECEDVRIPVRDGTSLEGFELPMTKILSFAYAWTKDYNSIKFCEKELKMNKQTTEDFNNFFREVCENSLLNESEAIGGEGMTVEIDETRVTKPKPNTKSDAYVEQWVFGGVCRETKEVFLFAVPDRDEDTLVEFIKKKIKPGTTIVSNCCHLFKGLENIEGYNYKLLSMNDRETIESNSTINTHTQQIENTFNNFKRRNKRHCEMKPSMLDSYLCEFIWRQRNAKQDLFIKILKDIAEYSKK